MVRTYPAKISLLATAFVSLFVVLSTLSVEAQVSTVTATANGESHLLIVVSGTTVVFQGNLSGLSEAERKNVDSYGWHFNRSHLNSPDNLSVTWPLFAEGVYNATFYVDFNDSSRSEHLVLVIVLFEEEDDPPYPTWFFTILGLGEMIAGCYLFYATWKFKQDRIYLHEAQKFLERTGKK